MAFWRPLASVVSLVILICVGIGCAPATSSQKDEENDINIQRGRTLEGTLDYAGAAKAYQTALEANPQCSLAHFRLAFLYVQQNIDPAAAIYHFQQFLKLRPNSEHASLIQQHIIGCKQELAREFATGPMADDITRQLDMLIKENQRLKGENQQLLEDSRRVQLELNRTHGGSGGSSAATDRAEERSSAPTPSVPSPGHRTARTYQVRSGDTYYAIAKRFGVTVNALQAANPGVNPNNLKIDQTLAVPSP